MSLATAHALSGATFHAMGGDVEVLSPQPLGDVLPRITHVFESCEQTMSRFLPQSELSALNRAAGRPFGASPALFDVVAGALRWSARTGGRFDPTQLAALEHAGYDATFDEVRLRPAHATPPSRARSGTATWRDVSLDAPARRITLPPGIGIDLGGIGKGWTLDRCIDALPHGTPVCINAGGDILARGDGPDGGGWRIGVANPLDTQTDLAVLRVADAAVATSGTTRRRWLTGGGEMHHIIDPRTGISADTDVLAVTVVTGSAVAADVLATTACVAGVREGLRLVEAQGADALAVSLTGATFTTSAWRRYVL